MSSLKLLNLACICGDVISSNFIPASGGFIPNSFRALMTEEVRERGGREGEGGGGEGGRGREGGKEGGRVGGGRESWRERKIF